MSHDSPEFWCRKKHAPEEVRAAVARAMGVDQSAIHVIDDSHQHGDAANVQVEYRDRGFLTRAIIFAASEKLPTCEAITASLAETLDDDVLGDPDVCLAGHHYDVSLAFWVRPDGSRWLCDLDDDLLDLDEAVVEIDDSRPNSVWPAGEPRPE